MPQRGAQEAIVSCDDGAAPPHSTLGNLTPSTQKRLWAKRCRIQFCAGRQAAIFSNGHGKRDNAGAMPHEVFPFRYRDPLTGKWIRARFGYDARPLWQEAIMILDDLYNSEINFKIATDWDAGWTVALGSDYSGFVAQANVRTFDEACKWLRAEAIKCFPDSAFARAATESTSGS
jgi:hypothetical protein